jgi:hypothetical protein
MRKFLMAVVAVAVLVAPASALASSTIPNGHTSLKISPRTPIVDEYLTVSFRPAKTLRAGWHYEAMLVGDSGYDCASLVVKKNYSARKIVSITFSPREDFLNEASEWCQGAASVLVYKSKPGVQGPTVGFTGFRFYGKP